MGAWVMVNESWYKLRKNGVKSGKGGRDRRRAKSPINLRQLFRSSHLREGRAGYRFGRRSTDGASSRPPLCWAMPFKPINLIFVAALFTGIFFFVLHRTGVEGIWSPALKRACVALLAIWAALQARTLDGWLIVASLALVAIGDVLLETHGMIAGGTRGRTILMLQSRCGHNRRNRPRYASPTGSLAAHGSWPAWSDRPATSAAPRIGLFAGAAMRGPGDGAAPALRG